MPRVSIFRAPLVAAYGAMPGRLTSDCSEAMLMIRPRPRGCMWRATAWPTRKALVTLVAIRAFQSSSGNSVNGARRCIPALLTQMSIGPTVSSIRGDAGGHRSRGR